MKVGDMATVKSGPFAGKVAKVENVYGDGSVGASIDGDSGYAFWGDDLVTTPRPFEVGDRVRIGDGFPWSLGRGDYGRITEIRDGDRWPYYVAGWWCDAANLTPINDEPPPPSPYTGSDLEREREIAALMDKVDYKWRSEKIQRLRKKFQRRNEPLPSLSDFNPNKWAGRNHLDLTEKSEQWDGNE
jgi:hypothetical protein